MCSSDLLEAKVGLLEERVELNEVESEVIKNVTEAFYTYRTKMLLMKSAMKKVYYNKKMLILKKHKLEIGRASCRERV